MEMSDFTKIKLLVTDVDGVLTDGGMYYFEDGNEAKKFNTRDGMAIQLIKEQGIRVIFLTKENTKIVANRAKKLGVEAYQGVTHKGTTLVDIMIKYDLQNEEVAYVGDDINDISPLEKAGIAICPADAVHEVKRVCNIVTNAKGGEGVIREIYEQHLKYVGKRR